MAGAILAMHRAAAPRSEAGLHGVRRCLAIRGDSSHQAEQIGLMKSIGFDRAEAQALDSASSFEQAGRTRVLPVGARPSRSRPQRPRLMPLRTTSRSARPDANLRDHLLRGALRLRPRTNG